MDGSQKHYAKGKKPETKEGVHTIWFYLREILEKAKLFY